MAFINFIESYTGNKILCKVVQFNYTYKFIHVCVTVTSYFDVDHSSTETKANVLRKTFTFYLSRKQNVKICIISLSLFLYINIYFVVGLLDGSEAVGGGGGPLRANSSR